MKITRARLAVIDCLAAADVPLSPRAIHASLRARSVAESTTTGGGRDDGSDIDQASVYRVIETLAEFDLVHRIFPSGDYTRCAHTHGTCSQHVLLRCQTCRHAMEVPLQGSALETAIASVTGAVGFKAARQILQIDGLCARCQGSGERRD